jgi:glycosyltransferase involved in cell wall biosynthesis
VSHKKRVLVFTDWFLPGFRAGGPIRSLTNMVAHLGDAYEFCFVTSDRDLFSETPYPGIKTGEWLKLQDGTPVIYLSPQQQNEGMIKKIILEMQADILYLNSMFSRNFTILPLRVRNRYIPTRKVILAPRGMLGTGALKIKAPKKKAFLLLSKLTGLYRNITWHASSTLEEAEIKKVIGKSANVHIALNLSPNYPFRFIPRKKSRGSLKLVFLSRITPKKNLDGTLKLLEKLDKNAQVEFTIYGPVEDQSYWDECKTIIHRLPSNIKVHHPGALRNDEVLDALSKHHVSILLTFNENFGHSIVESMAAGCPVLLSEHTPWRNLTAQKAGWDVSLASESKQLEALNAAINMDQQTFDVWSQATMDYAKSITQKKEVIEQNRKLFA